MKQKHVEMLAQKRRALISKTVGKVDSYGDIAKIFRISSTRVKQIYERGKEIEAKRAERANQPLPELSHWAFEAMKKVTGLRSPTLIDVARFIRKNADWKDKLLLTSRCGPKTVKEIEDYAGENGILKE